MSQRPLSCDVILACYDGGAFLQAQIASILQQTRIPSRIAVLDDVSSDGSWTRLKAATYPPIVYLHRHEWNHGIVGNFEYGMQQATGDVIALSDQDDRWLPDKLDRQMALFEARPDLLLVHGNATLVDADGRRLGATLFDALGLRPDEVQAIHAGRAFEVLVRRSVATGATMAFRRELVDVALPVGKGWLHDEWLALVAAAIGEVDVIEASLIDYRQHGGNAVGMRVRTLRDKWNDLRAERLAEFQTEVGRLRVLEDRLQALGGRVTGSKLDLLQARIDHMERRVAWGRLSHLRRVAPVWREWRGGFYKRFGTGLRSALRDLLRRD